MSWMVRDGKKIRMERISLHRWIAFFEDDDLDSPIGQSMTADGAVYDLLQKGSRCSAEKKP